MEAQHPEVANNTWQGPGGPDTPRVGEYLCFSDRVCRRAAKLVAGLSFEREPV